MRSFQYLAPIPKFEYVAPKTLSELFETLDGHGKELAIIAGGTDLTVALKERTYSPEIVVNRSFLLNIRSCSRKSRFFS